MKIYIVFYYHPNDYLDMQSIHSTPEEAIAAVPGHVESWGWGASAKNFSIQIWSTTTGYVEELLIPA